MADIGIASSDLDISGLPKEPYREYITFTLCVIVIV